jgi:hypothetical protein
MENVAKKGVSLGASASKKIIEEPVQLHAARTAAQEFDNIEAYKQRHSSDSHDWQAPGPQDVRSPCPALNTLANHGYMYVSC